MARTGFQKLNETICLLDRYLRQLAIFVKDVEHIPFGYPLSGQVACVGQITGETQPRQE